MRFTISPISSLIIPHIRNVVEKGWIPQQYFCSYAHHLIFMIQCHTKLVKMN